MPSSHCALAQLHGDVFQPQAHALHDGEHFAADVGEAVHGAFGEIPALDARAVAGIAVSHRRGRSLWEVLQRCRFETNLVHIDFHFDVIENEEFGFGAEIGGVGQPEAF
jgi:hypothetical protein